MCKHTSKKTSQKPLLGTEHVQNGSDSLDPTKFESIDAKAQSNDTTVDKTQEEENMNGAAHPEAKKSRFHVLVKLLPKTKSKESVTKASAEELKTAQKPEVPTHAAEGPKTAVESHTVEQKEQVTKKEIGGTSHTQQLPDEERKPIVAYAHRRIDTKKSKHDPEYQTLYELNKEWESDIDGFSAYANIVDTTQISTAKVSAETATTQVTASAEPVP